MKWTIPLALALMAFLVGFAPALAESRLDRVKARGVLVVGVEAENPPYSFFNRARNGEIDGFDVEYAGLLAAKLGVRAQYVALDRPQRLSRLIGGQVDLLAGNVTYGSYRDRLIDFSQTYTTGGQGFIARKGAVNKMGDLVGKKIGTILGTPSESCAKNVCIGGILVPYDNYADALQALKIGEITAFTSDQTILVDLFPTLPQEGFEISGLVITTSEYVLGLPQGDAAFAKAVNGAIDAIRASGEDKRLKDRWFTIRDSRPQVAYGAIVRKAVVETRFLAIALNGTFFPNAEVSIYAADGNLLGKGTIAGTIGDEFYLDVTPEAYNLIQSGNLVTLNINNETAKSILEREQPTLQQIRKNVDEEEQKASERSQMLDDEKTRLNQQLELLRQQNELQIDLERERYRQYYRNFRRTFDNFR